MKGFLSNSCVVDATPLGAGLATKAEAEVARATTDATASFIVEFLTLALSAMSFLVQVVHGIPYMHSSAN